MNRPVRVFLLTWLISLVACDGGHPVEINRASAKDITVRVVAVPVPMAAHGEIVVTEAGSERELARIRVIQADDYVEDVRFRIKDVRADGSQIKICMKDTPLDRPSLIFTSVSGVTVTLIDAESDAYECPGKGDGGG